MKDMKTKTATDFSVMLAHKINDKPLNLGNERYFVQPKLDGIRCYITKDGAFSRNHKQFKNIEHILYDLKPLFRDYPDIILDGELYNHDLRDNFNKIISLCRKKVNISLQDREEARQLIQFHAYDLYRGTDEEYCFRWSELYYLNAKYMMPSFHVIDMDEVKNQNGIDFAHKVNKNKGYEGSMVRSNGFYEQKRSWTLQKVKDWSDTEFTITGFVQGKGKFEGGLGKFLGFDLEGREVEIPWPNITIANRKLVWQNKNYYIGKLATFEFFERTKDGAYRFPRFKTIRNYE